MDIASLIGVVSGVGLILASILMNCGLALFVNSSALMIIAGRTLAAIFIAYPLKDVLKVMSLLRRVFFHKTVLMGELVDSMIAISKIAKQNGILALDKELKNIQDDFFRKGIQFIVDGVTGSTIVNMLHLELVNEQKRHKTGYMLFNEMGKYAPAFGMIGTLIGLIQMLADLADPGSIGPKMAVALITTFYGSLLANLVFIPMSVKLKSRSHQESQRMLLIIEAVNPIRTGEHHRILADKLSNFMSEEERNKQITSNNAEVKEDQPGE